MDRRIFVQGLVASGTALVAGDIEAKPSITDVPPVPGAPADISDTSPQQVRRIDPDEPGAENVWPLLTPLRPGDMIGLGWRVVELSAVSAGAAILTLASNDRTERVHLCRLDGVARGVAHSESIDLLLMNRADGTIPTDEDLARVLNVLALLIRSNERAGASAPDGLIGHDARLAFFCKEQALV